MPRPRKWRHICAMPERKVFGPLDVPADRNGTVTMLVDEYETIRLIDLDGLTQEECAQQMNVARTTVQGIYAAARKKLALALVEGRVLVIEGGDYTLCDGQHPFCRHRACRRGRGRGRRHSGPTPLAMSKAREEDE